MTSGSSSYTRSGQPPLAPTPVSGFLQELDEPKQRAVETGSSSPDFTLVQGPPGTGKTTFIAELIAQLLAGKRTREFC